MYGPFHHFLQNPNDLPKIIATNELWGRPPNGSDIPQVQAYRGEAPPGRKNVITFETAAAVKPGTAYFDVRWHPDYPDVRLENGYAKISIRILSIA